MPREEDQLLQTKVISTARNRLLGTIIIWKWLCSMDANLASNRSARFKYAQTASKVELLRRTDGMKK